MGKVAEFMLNIEDLATDAATSHAADTYYLYQDFMHEQRDMIRESIEIAILDNLTDGWEMDDFWSFMGFEDEDDYHTWLDETATQALADEGMVEI